MLIVPVFLRSVTSLVQTSGRAARNVDGQVLLYGDTITAAMADAIAETQRRRDIQMKYNEDNNITPATIQKAIAQLISESTEEYVTKKSKKTEKTVSIIEKVTGIEDIETIIVDLTRQMNKASVELDFELAATLRDQISELKEQDPAEK